MGPACLFRSKHINENSIWYINHSFSIPLQRPNYFIKLIKLIFCISLPTTATPQFLYLEAKPFIQNQCSLGTTLRTSHIALVGMSFLSLIITPTLWLALLHISLIWILKFNCSSMVTPDNLRLPEDSMVFPWKSNGISLTVLLCVKDIVWYLLRFPFWRLLAYQPEVFIIGISY